MCNIPVAKKHEKLKQYSTSSCDLFIKNYESVQLIRLYVLKLSYFYELFYYKETSLLIFRIMGFFITLTETDIDYPTWQ